jgi:hypothetical protein
MSASSTIGLSIVDGNWWCNSCETQLDKISMLEHIFLAEHDNAVAAHAEAIRKGVPFVPPPKK